MRRMQTVRPLITAQRLEAYTASALRGLTWLLGVVFTIGSHARGRRVRSLITLAERVVESILFLEAVLRYGPPPRRRGYPRPTPTGFRRCANYRLALLFKRAGVRARRASALTRVLRLFEVLARPERYIAFFLKRVLRGLRPGALAPAAPPAFACADLAARDAAFADSS
jgi:hypothetical protein